MPVLRRGDGKLIVFLFKICSWKNRGGVRERCEICKEIFFFLELNIKITVVVMIIMIMIITMIMILIWFFFRFILF
mgnify:CR=1 FL=1